MTEQTHEGGYIPSLNGDDSVPIIYNPETDGPIITEEQMQAGLEILRQHYNQHR